MAAGDSDLTLIKPKATWWIAPFSIGVLLSVGAAILVPMALPRHHPAAPKAKPATVSVPMPAMMFPDGLFRQLSQDLQDGDENSFLAMVAPAARPQVTMWWDNLRAIGFTTGAVIPTASHDAVQVDSHGDGSAVVLAGAHSPLDPVDAGGKPYVPLGRYQVGLHFASPGSVGQITSWKPLSGAPWDGDVRLYVRKTAHVVVAGPPGDSGLVDETLPIAEAAASYDIGLVSHVNSGDLRQQGFVVFVSGAASTRDGWLAAVSQPKGWPSRLLGARVFQLPGAGASTNAAPGIADGTTGGARVVVTPFEQQPGQTAHAETVTLVREFMLDILAARDEEFVNGIPLLPVPSWAEQGLAVAVQGLFEANTNPLADQHSFAPLTRALRALPRAFRNGHLPSAAQLYGPDLATDENWNDVAASVYEYIEQKYGMNQMLAAAMLLYTREPAPWGNVLRSQHNGAYVFYRASQVQSGWRRWLAHL